VDDHVRYLALLALCLVLTAPLEFLGRGVYRRFGALVRTVLPVLAVFVAWDVVAVAGGEWSFAPAFTVPLRLPGGLPIEEVLFFAVVPVCALLTYEAVSALLPRVRRLIGGR
jgi:lycopene beta-cyclase